MTLGVVADIWARILAPSFTATTALALDTFLDATVSARGALWVGILRVRYPVLVEIERQ